MSIVDSDDLQSEITDITVVSSKSLENINPDVKAFKKLCMAQTNILNILQGQINNDDDISTNRKVNNWLAQTSGPVTQLIYNKKNCEPQGSNVSNCYYSENEINKLKGKLNHIIDSLRNKKCHKAYLTVIDELLDWIYSIILNNMQVTNNEPDVIDSVLEHNNYVVKVQNHETSKKSGIYCPSDYSIDTECEDAYNDFMRERMFTEADKTGKNSNSDSENEIFDRVSEISNGQMLQQEDDINSNFMHQITIEYSNAAERSEKINGANFNYSSINIAEDEREHSKVKMSKNMKHNELLSRSKEAANRISKPTSSVPVIVNNASNDLKHFIQEPTVNVIENVNEDIKEWNKKTEDLTQKETSSMKFKNKKKSISFCEKWKLLQSDECSKQEATDVDAISIGRSLKGRRIIPPLKYWTGERVFSKGDNTLYTPSTSQVPLAAISNDNPSKKKSKKKQ